MRRAFHLQLYERIADDTGPELPEHVLVELQGKPLECPQCSRMPIYDDMSVDNNVEPVRGYDGRILGYTQGFREVELDCYCNYCQISIKYLIDPSGTPIHTKIVRDG